MSRMEMWGVEGIGEVHPGDVLADLITDAISDDGCERSVHRRARRRRARRHAEDRVEGRRPGRRHRPRRPAVAQAARRGGSGAGRAAPRRSHRDRDQARLRVRERRHRPLEHGTGMGRALAARLRSIGSADPRRRARPHGMHGRRRRLRHVRTHLAARVSPTSRSAARALQACSTYAARPTLSAERCR